MSKNQKIIYPHRLSFSSNKCDICKLEKHSRCVIRLEQDRYIGWQTCKDNECNKIVKNTKLFTTVSNDSLNKKYGEYIYVERSNGKIEYMWKIIGEGYKENKKQDWIIKVRNDNKHLTKCVSMKDLDSWNKIGKKLNKDDNNIIII
jgi:hypothetical protein